MGQGGSAHLPLFPCIADPGSHHPVVLTGTEGGLDCVRVFGVRDRCWTVFPPLLQQPHCEQLSVPALQTLGHLIPLGQGREAILLYVNRIREPNYHTTGSFELMAIDGLGGEPLQLQSDIG